MLTEVHVFNTIVYSTPLNWLFLDKSLIFKPVEALKIKEILNKTILNDKFNESVGRF